MASSTFLTGQQTSDWIVDKPPAGYTPQHIYVGNDPDFNMPLEIAVTQTTQTHPSREALQKLHKARVGNRGYALVVVALNNQNAWLFGPNPQAAPAGPFEIGQAQRLLQSALDEPNQVAAVNRLGQLRPATDETQELGVTNSGLFASYHIRTNVPHRSDWQPSCDKSKPILSKSGTDLIKALGFNVQRSSGDTLVLAGSTASSRAVAVLLKESEQFEARADRYQVSPVAYGLKTAAEQDVPWLILLRGGQIRLYPAKDGVGVGQRGQSDTFFELDLALLSDEMSGLLHLIFSAEALAPEGTTQQILADSARYATNLGVRLKNRIYDHVVPELARAVAGQLPTLKVAVDADGLQLAYRLTLRILFRLLFQAYAEDRGLLPYGRNPRYDRNALKTLVTDDLIPNNGGDFDAESQTLWDDLEQVWRVIDKGDKAWGVPAYNGGLFGTDEELHPEGALINHIRLTNNVMGPVLDHMLIDISEDGVRGPVDFRSLSVREFGTIYEGLLESSLSLADQDLTVDSKGAWVPAKEGDQIEAPAGSVYFHSASGERKATGSYFTPSVIVEHLLDRALEPALEQHLAKVSEALDAGDEAKAHEIFFDFRVADLAMGSGHFLVAAVDRIETAMRNYLVDRSVPGVTNELIKLEAAAKEALGSDYEFSGDIDRAGLLRRQVARRCIYGLDINPLAVELSRLALWIHTFVPGLPMSSLDHGLVCANSLTGIGTVEEALKELDPKSASGAISIFSDAIEDALNDAKDLLIEAANASEATPKEVKEATKIAAKAREAALPTKFVFDAAVAARLGVTNPANFVDADTLRNIGASDAVQEAVGPLNPAHMPYLFPEVFLRENPGFDVLLGNPPFLNRIENLSRGEDRVLLALQSKYSAAGKGYTNYASLFLYQCILLAKQTGYVTLVQPESLIATRDSQFVRKFVTVDSNLVHIWIALENVFEANVRTCAPVVCVGLKQAETVTRSVGRLAKPAVELTEATHFLSGETWSGILSDLIGVPRVSLVTSNMKLSDIADCLSGDFIGNFYELSEFVTDSGGKDDPKLITVGLVDPLLSKWGAKGTKFNKQKFAAPRIDFQRAQGNPKISKLLTDSMVPKVLLATQTKVLEPYVDYSGSYVASIPLLSVVPYAVDNLWRISAMLMSPALNAEVARQVLGAGLVTSALKLSKPQLLNIPLPFDETAWNLGATLVREISLGLRVRDVASLSELGRIMSAAYGVESPSLVTWWLERLGDVETTQEVSL